MKKIAHVFPLTPGDRSAIAHYAMIVERELSALCAVLRFSKTAFAALDAASLAAAIRDAGCDAVILQYTPNLYGWRNVFPCRLLWLLRKAGVRTLTVFHEIFMPDYPTLPGRFVMRPVNFMKDRAVLGLTDLPVVTFRFRADTLRKRFKRECAVLPVCSNIPLLDWTDVPKSHRMGFFGTAHADVHLDRMLAAAGQLGEKMLFIGDFPESKVPRSRADVTGFLPALEVAAHLGRITYFVICDRRGLSFRKGSAAAALMFGLPLIANPTAWTEPEFKHGENVYFYDGSADGLVGAVRELDAHPVLAERIGGGGRRLYEERLAPGRTAAAMVRLLEEAACV